MNMIEIVKGGGRGSASHFKERGAFVQENLSLQTHKDIHDAVVQN